MVDLDLETFSDRVNHDKLMSLVKGRGMDRRVLQRIDRDLKAGALTGHGVEETPEGTPQGGRGRPCWQTCYWRGWIRNLRSGGTAGCPCGRWGATCGDRSRDGTPMLAMRKRRPSSRNWTPGAGVAAAASGGSRGGDAAIGN